MEELEYLYKSIPAYSTNEYKVAERNIDLKIIPENLPPGDIVFTAEDTRNLLCKKKNMSVSEFLKTKAGLDLKKSIISAIKTDGIFQVIESMVDIAIADEMRKSIESKEYDPLREYMESQNWESFSIDYRDMLLTRNEGYYKKPKLSSDTTVSQLKKQIKHCKNPLEKRNLEKQLNALYKERKNKSWINKSLENKQNAMN